MPLSQAPSHLTKPTPSTSPTPIQFPVNIYDLAPVAHVSERTVSSDPRVADRSRERSSAPVEAYEPVQKYEDPTLKDHSHGQESQPQDKDNLIEYYANQDKSERESAAQGWTVALEKDLQLKKEELTFQSEENASLALKYQLQSAQLLQEQQRSAELLGRAEKFENECRSLRKELSLLQQNIDDYDSHQQHSETAIVSLRSQLVSSNEKAQSCEANLARASQALNHLEREHVRTKDQLSQKEQHSRNLDQTLIRTQDLLNQANTELGRTKQERDNALRKVDKNTQIESDLKLLRDDLNRTIPELGKTKNDLMQSRNEVQQLKTLLIGQNEEIQRLKNELIEKSSECSTLSSQFVQAKHDLLRLQSAVDLRMDLQETKQELLRTSAELNQFLYPDLHTAPVDSSKNYIGYHDNANAFSQNRGIPVPIDAGGSIPPNIVSGFSDFISISRDVGNQPFQQPDRPERERQSWSESRDEHESGEIKAEPGGGAYTPRSLIQTIGVFKPNEQDDSLMIDGAYRTVDHTPSKRSNKAYSEVSTVSRRPIDMQGNFTPVAVGGSLLRYSGQSPYGGQRLEMTPEEFRFAGLNPDQEIGV